MTSTSLALHHDAQIRVGDCVCTEGAFDLQEAKHRAVLHAAPAVGLRALRDRRLVSLRQAANGTANSNNTPAARAAASAQAAAAADPRTDLVPVSPNMLQFAHGPSSGLHQKRPPSRVPSKNRQELERIARLVNGDAADGAGGGGNGDDDDDDHHLDDEAALLRAAAKEAKKWKAQQQRAMQMSAWASAASVATPAIYSYYNAREPTEREKQFVQMVDDAIPTIIGTSAVRLFGVALAVDGAHATVQVWRRGGTIYTDKRPLERLPLPSLQKLTKREFTLCVSRPLVAFADTRTRKAISGAADVEDMPATLMAHTNEIVESLINKMHQTAAVQQQAVADELASMRQAVAMKRNAKAAAARLSGSTSPAGSLINHRHSNPNTQVRSPSAAQQQFHHLHGGEQPRPLSASLTAEDPLLHHGGGGGGGGDDLTASTIPKRGGSAGSGGDATAAVVVGAGGSSNNSSTNASAAVFGTAIAAAAAAASRRGMSSTPPPAGATAVSGGLPPLSPTPDPASASLRSPQHHHHHPFRQHQHQQRQQPPLDLSQFKLALGKDRHKKLRGTTLRSRVTAQARATLDPGSALLQRYHDGGRCGLAVVRSLPEPPVTRLIDPLVDVRDELKSLAVMGGGGASTSASDKFQPQSEYIRSLHRTELARRPGSASSGAGGDATSASASALAASGSLVPVLGMRKRPGSSSAPISPHASRPASGAAAAAAAGSSNAQHASLTADTTASKLPPPPQSFVELALEDVRSPPRGVGGHSVSRQQLQQQQQLQSRSSSGDLLGSTPHPHMLAASSPPASSKRVAQPVPPCLLYSSYAADSDALPPEIPCTVLEYRPQSQTLLMTVRRQAFAASSGGGGGGTGSTPGGTGRTGTLLSSRSKPSSAGNGTGRSSSNSAQQNGKSLAALQRQDALQKKWHAAAMGLSTILVKCAFVDVSRADGAALATLRQQQQQQQQQQAGLNNMSLGATLGFTVGGAATLGGHAGTPESGDEYLLALEGKTVDVVPLWSVCLNDGNSGGGAGPEYAVVADIQRGDLSILDEMVAIKVAEVSQPALTEYNELKALFAAAQHAAAAAGLPLSPQKAASFAWARAAAAPAVAATSPFGTIQREESSGADFVEGASGMPEATTAMLSHEASMAMSRLKSSYFSTTAAHAVLEEDPDTHINAAESFLGRRVFRLLQSSSKSSTVSQQSQQGGEARRAGKPTASRAAATEMMIDLGDAAYNKAMTQSMEVASEGNSDGSGSSSSSGGSAPTSARDFG